MPEKIKQLAAEAAEAMRQIPESQRDLAARFAETFATGISVGCDICRKEDTGSEQPHES